MATVIFMLGCLFISELGAPHPAAVCALAARPSQICCFLKEERNSAFTHCDVITAD